MSRSQPQGLVLKASRVLLKNPLPRTGVEGDIEAQGPASKAQLTLAALTCKTGRTGLHGAGGGVTGENLLCGVALGVVTTRR